MLLGANITGEIDGKFAHAFATPIQLEELAKESMTLPILAYDAIEIGTMTISLNGTQVDVNVEYNINENYYNSNYIPEDAKIYWKPYTEKPELSELLNGDHYSAKLEASGTFTLKSIDVSEYMNENGELKGLVWLYAAVDTKIDKDTLVNDRAITPYCWDEYEKIDAINVKVADKHEEYFDLYKKFYELAA